MEFPGYRFKIELYHNMDKNNKNKSQNEFGVGDVN